MLRPSFENCENMIQNSSLTIKYNSITMVGSKRKHNQDAYAEFQVAGGHGFVVCDGINGKEGGGAIASKMAVESIKRQFRNNQFRNPQKALTNALTLANFQLFDHVQKNDRFEGMGTSCGIVLIIDGLAYYAYIGNVRIYFLRENTIYRLTRDHTLAQTALSENKITEAQLEDHADYYTPDRALGFNKDVNFTVCKQPISVEENDLLLITTDGLYRELSESQMAEIMNDADASVEFIASNLARKADEAGGNDNITLSLIHAFNAANVPFEADANVSHISEPLLKKVPRAVWIVLGILGLVAVLFGINEMAFHNESLTHKITDDTTTVSDVAPNNIVVKDTVKATEIKEVVAEVETVQPKFVTYEIEKGDNFYRLGIRYNVTVQYLERINNVQSNRLRIGRRIRIPVKDMHTVKTGENLSLIGSKYLVSVKDILKANKLENADNLREGMELLIPLQYDDKLAE